MNPSIFDFMAVNFVMKEYTKAVSHRSRGCVAFDGGQTCPFFSDCVEFSPIAIGKDERVEEAELPPQKRRWG
jgi:hypothetical protein